MGAERLGGARQDRYQQRSGNRDQQTQQVGKP
jgi:hypothetical protein